MHRDLQPRAARALPMPAPGAPPRPQVPTPRRATLTNGLRVVAVEHGALPQVALKLIVPTGAVADPEGARGLAALTGALLLEGTARHTAEALSDRLDALGASVSVHTGHDLTQLEMLLLAETIDEALGLLGEVLSEPAFPDAELERHRAEMLDALEARLDEPANVADDHASIAIFGTDHAYGHLSSGTPEGIRSLTRAQVVEFHRRYLRPEGAVLIAAGALDPERLAVQLADALGGWRGGSAPAPYPVQRGTVPARRIDVPWPDASQAEIRVAGAGLARSSPDWIAAAVANYLLGGSTVTGRLGLNLREDKGWTYGIRSGFSAGFQAAGWVVDTAVEREVADDAVAEIMREIRAVVDAGVTVAELDRAREAMILSLPRAFETPARVVGRLATQEVYGLGERYWMDFAERVERISLAEVRRVSRAYFDPDHLVTVVVG
jgi:zinc protease